MLLGKNIFYTHIIHIHTIQENKLYYYSLKGGTTVSTTESKVLYTIATLQACTYCLR